MPRRSPYERLRSAPWQRATLVITIAVVLFLVLAGVVILLIPIAVAVPILLLRNWLERRRFIRNHANEWFLVATRRRRWGDFVVNNVMPAMAAGSYCIWDGGPNEAQDVAHFVRRRLRRPYGLRRPYLVVVRPRPGRFVFAPLHEQLLPFKKQAAKNVEAQRVIAVILRQAVDESDLRRQR